MSEMKPIPYGKQTITEEDIREVTRVLQSDFLTQGPAVSQFEKAFAEYVQAPYAVAVANGTAALHLSVLALGLLPGQKVICSPITFAASSNCVLYAGGVPVFADIHPETFCLDPEKAEDLLRKHPKGTFTGIIPVDMAGYPVNSEDFRLLAQKYDLPWIIEDACHAPGAYFTDKSGKKEFAGSGKFSDLNIFSFHPVKHIATGEGGMITTRNRDLYDSLRSLRDLLKIMADGITKCRNWVTTTA
jgi:dTDP-4-amino-4,6-dideoxygalactose transaminase